MRAQLTDWTTHLRTDDKVVAEQVRRWQQEIGLCQGVLDPAEAKMLRRLTPPPSFARVKAQAEAVTALSACARKYEAIKDSEFTSGGVISGLLDDLLIQLVTEYDDEELPLTREVAYQDAIIDTGGDLDRARAKADQEVSVLDERVDAVTLQTNAAIAPDSLGVSVRTQQVAIGAGKEDFRTAVRAYTKKYRMEHVSNVPLNLAPDHHATAQNMGFPGFSTSTEVDENVMATQLRQVWEQTFADYIHQVSFKNSQMVLPIAVALGVSLLFLIVNWAVGILVLLVAGGVAAFVIMQMQNQARDRVNKAVAVKEAAYMKSFTMLQDARAEFEDLEMLYEERDADEDELLRVIDVWPDGDNSKKEN